MVDRGGKAGAHLAFDLGALWRFADRFAFGAAVLNAGSPKFKAGGWSDRAPLTFKVGVSEQIRGAAFALDFIKREPSLTLSGQHTMGIGFERWWATARAGQYAVRSGMSLGERARTWSWGLGWRGQGSRLDYSMTVPLTGITRLGHGLSLTIRFGRADPEGEYEKLLSEELRYRRQMGAALEAGELKQWRLSEELTRLRAEMVALRAEMDAKRASEGEAKRRLKDLEQRRQAAAETFEKLKAEREAAAHKTKAMLFQEEWRSYQKAKLSNVPDQVLIEQVGRLLRQYKDSGVDLGEATQELRRLQLAK